MSRAVPEETIEQIWRDLGERVARSRIAEVARAVAADLGNARVPAYLPLFVCGLVCERLGPEAGARAPRAARQRADR